MGVLGVPKHPRNLAMGVAYTVGQWLRNDRKNNFLTTTKVQVYEASRPKISCKCYVRI